MSARAARLSKIMMPIPAVRRYPVSGMNLLIRIVVIALLTNLVTAAELILPAVVERDGPVIATFRTGPQAIGAGALEIRWTDILGRVVEERRIPVRMTDESEIRFSLDMRRAVAMINTVTAHLSLEELPRKGAPAHRDETASVGFIAKPADRKWLDYAIIMWQPHSAERMATLRTLGVTGGQHLGRSMEPPASLLKNNMRWYAENIATDFYAEYHRYRPDRTQEWSFLQAKAAHRKDPQSKEPFKRRPSLSNPEWLRAVHDRLVASARRFSPYRPLFYDLADESGIANLAAFWDFDFSDESLAEMRSWLKDRYGSLASLNTQWGSAFASWDDVTPDSTDEAMKRSDGNYSSWSDHKEWMDVSFSRALQMGVDAVQSVDPGAYVAIAGGQMPGWGGYDYWRLSQTLTAIEPYDIGNNIEMLRSFAPRLPFVTTAFARGPWEEHRIWYELLHGARGNIIWDENFEMAPEGGKPGPRGLETAPYYREIRSGLGALLIQSTRLSDAVAIHYSQPSMRVEWMLAQRPKGVLWANRNSATERMDSEFLRLRESYCKLVEDLGLQYRFVSYAQVEDGELARRGYRVLILPRSTALSEAEAREMRRFVEQGGVIITDGEPGVFDEHGRRLDASRLAGVPMTLWSVLPYYQDRLRDAESARRDEAVRLFDQSGVCPPFIVLDEVGRRAAGVETHTFRNGASWIVALLGNPEMRVDELGPPDFKSNARFEKPRKLRLVLPSELYVHNIRSGNAMGRLKEIGVTLEPYAPAMFALTAEPPAEAHIRAPRVAVRGELVRVEADYGGSADGVAHFEVTDPNGAVHLDYTGSAPISDGVAERLIPFAVNDPAGAWTVRVRDVLTGRRLQAVVELR